MLVKEAVKEKLTVYVQLFFSPEVRNKFSFSSPRKPSRSFNFSFCIYDSLKTKHLQKSAMPLFLPKHMASLCSFLLDLFLVLSNIT